MSEVNDGFGNATASEYLQETSKDDLGVKICPAGTFTARVGQMIRYWEHYIPTDKNKQPLPEALRQQIRISYQIYTDEGTFQLNRGMSARLDNDKSGYRLTMISLMGNNDITDEALSDWLVRTVGSNRITSIAAIQNPAYGGFEVMVSVTHKKLIGADGREFTRQDISYPSAAPKKIGTTLVVVPPFEYETFRKLEDIYEFSLMDDGSLYKLPWEQAKKIKEARKAEGQTAAPAPAPPARTASVAPPSFAAAPNAAMEVQAPISSADMKAALGIADGEVVSEDEDNFGDQGS